VGDSNKERGQKRSPNRVIERKKEKKNNRHKQKYSHQRITLFFSTDEIANDTFIYLFSSWFYF
jgi:hypothetical protein